MYQTCRNYNHNTRIIGLTTPHVSPAKLRLLRQTNNTGSSRYILENSGNRVSDISFKGERIMCDRVIEND